VRARFSAVCGLCIPSEEQLRLLNDKGEAAARAASAGIPVPLVYEAAPGEAPEALSARVTLPCVVKPLCGERLGLPAERRYAIARTARELSERFAHFSRLAGEPPLVQEYMPGGGLCCSLAWLALAYSDGNPERPVPPPPRPEPERVRMRFFPSDQAAALGYFRRGDYRRALSSLGDLFRPSVRDGLWDWRDIRPALSYLRGLSKRNR
jgi:hypothetical protein